MHALDARRAAGDVARMLVPLALPLALDDSDDAARAAVLVLQQLVALLPPDAAAAAAQAAVQRLEAEGAEDAAVAAARVFAHTAASWSEGALRERAPEYLRRWCGHRNFTVREAVACCMSLVGRRLPVDVWQGSLLPWFSALCRDNNWRVRRAAALDLPRLAGALHAGHRWRPARRPDSTCSCSTGSRAGAEDSSACSSSGASPRSAGSGGSGCSACGSGGAEAGGSGGSGSSGGSSDVHRCPISGVPVEPLGMVPTGACANLSGSSTAGYGSRPADEERRRQQAGAMATLASSVWSVHARRSASAANSLSGSAASMGKHPLSSSLLVDEPAESADDDDNDGGGDGDNDDAASSSSLSSPDERVLPGGAPADGAGGSGAEATSAAGGHVAAGAPASNSAAAAAGEADTAQQQESAAPAAAAAAPGDGGDAAAAKPAPACALALEAPALHACWDAVRACLDAVTSDSSHWVKVTALSGLGPCLLALPPCQLSGLLLGRFVAMGSSTTVIYEISVALACAQSFGLVAARLGPARWPDVRPAFSHMQASRNPAVLQELVDALPALARRLGPDALRGDLLPSLLSILHHHLGWVDAAFVRAAAPLLEALPEEQREPLLRVLSKLAGAGHGAPNGGPGAGAAASERCRAWRLRRDIAAQLGRLARASPRGVITETLWPIAIGLCSDPVAAVRAAAAAEIGPLMAALLPLVSADTPALQLDGRGSSSGGGASAANEDGAAAAAPEQQQQEQQQQQQQRAGSEPQLQKQGPASAGSSDRSAQQWQRGRARRKDGCESDSESEDPAANCGAAAVFSALSSPTRSAASGSSHSSGSAFARFADDDCDEEGLALFGGLPCALAAPPSGALSLSAEEDSVASSSGADEDDSARRAFDRDASPQPDGGASRGSSSDGGSPALSGSDDDRSPGGLAGRHSSDGGRHSSDGGRSSSDGGGSDGDAPRAATPERRGGPVHPGMTHPGMVGALHPAMAPVGSWAGRPPRTAPKRCVSTGALRAADRRASPSPAFGGGPNATAVPSANAVRRRSSESRLTPTRAASLPPPGLDPLCVGPGLYVDALVDRFARAPSFQGRQLFVAIALGLLANAAPLLPERKRRLIVAALQELARDGVGGVRVVAEGAAAALQAAAAEAQQLAQQQQQQQPAAAAQEQQQREQQGGAGLDGGGSSGDEAGGGAAAAAAAALAFDGSLLSSRQFMLQAARALAKECPGSFEAAAVALCAAARPPPPAMLGSCAAAGGIGAAAAAAAAANPQVNGH